MNLGGLINKNFGGIINGDGRCWIEPADLFDGVPVDKALGALEDEKCKEEMMKPWTYKRFETANDQIFPSLEEALDHLEEKHTSFRLFLYRGYGKWSVEERGIK